MDQVRPFYYNVPGIPGGTVKVTEHARLRAEEEQISEDTFGRVLYNPTKADTPDGRDTVCRERGYIRAVLAMGATPAVVTVYRRRRELMF